MSDRSKITALYRRLGDERRKAVENAAAADALPPFGLLTHLAALDGSIAAVAVLAEAAPASAVR